MRDGVELLGAPTRSVGNANARTASVGFSYTSAGTVLPAALQTVGDCQKLACNGTGGTISKVDNADVPADDGNACTSETCANGTPEHPATATDTPCSLGGNYCNGAGKCVACNGAAECANQGSVCQNAACTMNTCGFANLAMGVPAKSGAQTIGDCKIVLCDGTGNPSAPTPDDNDLPVDGNPCTFDVCTNGVPSNPPAPAGARPAGRAAPATEAATAVGRPPTAPPAR